MSNSNIIHATTGKLAKAIIVCNEDNSRTAHITFKSGKKLHVPTDHINLRAMSAKTAAEAVDKVCHGTGRIALYAVTQINGKAAMTRAYSSTHEGRETGYGLLVKRGQKASTFALASIDLAKMKAKNALAAMRTAAFTGRIATVARPS